MKYTLAKLPLKYTLLFILLIITQLSFPKNNDRLKVKCMVQMINYVGEGAYVVVSLLDADGNYVKTLRMLGTDKEWYPDMVTWYSFFSAENKPNIDAISGASVAGGERSIFSLEIDSKYLDTGHQLRFETAVENQKYHENDVLIKMTRENVNGSFKGIGYVRYVRLILSE